MRGTDATKLAGTAGKHPETGQQFAVLVAPGWVRILRAVPHARGQGGKSDVKRLHERGSEGSQAPSRLSNWAEAAEGLPSGLHYLN